MISQLTRDLLRNRPDIVYASPRSGETIATPIVDTSPKTSKQEKVSQLINDLENVATVAQGIERLIADRIKDEVMKLDIRNPDDVMVGQAAARQFPDKAKTIGGLLFVEEITFSMFDHCVQELKQKGIDAGKKQESKPPETDLRKTNFGGIDQDRRPEINQSTIPFAPLDITAFVAAGIPILFTMLFPLINATVKANIVGHTHPIITAPPSPIPVPSGPGLPVIP